MPCRRKVPARHILGAVYLTALLRCTGAAVLGRVRASPEAPSAPLVAVLDEGQQLAPGHEEAAEAPQDTLQVSLQHARRLQCNSLCLQAP